MPNHTLDTKSTEYRRYIRTPYQRPCHYDLLGTYRPAQKKEKHIDSQDGLGICLDLQPDSYSQSTLGFSRSSNSSTSVDMNLTPYEFDLSANEHPKDEMLLHPKNAGIFAGLEDFDFGLHLDLHKIAPTLIASRPGFRKTTLTAKESRLDFAFRPPPFPATGHLPDSPVSEFGISSSFPQ